MRFELARRSLLAALLAAGSIFTAGCSLAADADSEDEETGASDDAIVDIDNSRVKRQSIGNCWLYATASWAESLAKQVPGATELNMERVVLDLLALVRSDCEWQRRERDLDGRAGTPLPPRSSPATAS